MGRLGGSPLPLGQGSHLVRLRHPEAMTVLLALCLRVFPTKLTGRRLLREETMASRCAGARVPVRPLKGCPASLRPPPHACENWSRPRSPCPRLHPRRVPVSAAASPQKTRSVLGRRDQRPRAVEAEVPLWVQTPPVPASQLVAPSHRHTLA